MFKLFIILVSIASVQAQEICELDHINGSKKLMGLSKEAIEAACKVHEKNKCKPSVKVIEPVQNLDPNSLADSLISKDKLRTDRFGRIKPLIGELFETASAEDKTLTKSKLESLIKEKIVEFVKVRNCEPAFGETSVPQTYDEIGGKQIFKDKYSEKKAIETLTKRLNDPEFKKGANEIREAGNQKDFYDFLKNKTIKNDRRDTYVNFCSKDIIFKTKGSPEGNYPTCTGSVSKYFEDNFAILKPESEEARLKDQQAISKCISDTKAAGYDVDEVTINSSANKLKNTANWIDIAEGRGYCGYDFLSLSKARAEFTAKNILPDLLPANSGILPKINPEGDDGMGASGDCPYDAKGELKEEFIGAGKKKLEKFKTTEIIVKFKPTQTQKGSTSLRQFARLGSSCSAIKIKCKGDR